jgi:aspartyl-tRNA(Asn)/glutamyl-tRNA(Gln) amidotransferase subunit A
MTAGDEICRMDATTLARQVASWRFFRSYDLLLTPTLAVPPFEHGLPIGMQIVGRRMDDALVLRASAAFEAAAPWRDRRPALISTP